MAENRLTQHQILREEFEQEMTMVLLELKEEFSPERVEAHLAEYSAALPPPPKIQKAAGEVTTREALKRVSIHQTQLPEEPPKPLSTLNKDAIPRVTVAGGGRKLSLLPLVIPLKRLVALPGAVRSREPAKLKKAEPAKVALAKRDESAKTSGEAARKRLENKPPKFQVAICGAKLPKEGTPLKLGAVPAVAVPAAPAAKLTTLLSLPAKRSVALPAVSPPKEKEALSLQKEVLFRCYPGKFQLPGPVERKELKPLALNKPTEVALSRAMPQERAKPLRLQIFYHVAVPGRAAACTGVSLVLPGKRKVAVREPSLPAEARDMKVKMLDVPDKVPMTGEIPQRELLRVAAKLEARRVQRPRPVNMGMVERLRVEAPKDTGKWFDLAPKKLQAGDVIIPIPTGKPKENIALEQAPNLMELWERMDGPVALIADFGRV